MSDKYNRIVKALRAAGLQSVEDALDRAVTAEKDELFKINRKRDGGRAAMAAAMEFYADEIAEFLRADKPTTMTWNDVCHFIAQGVVNIGEGHTTIEKGSRVYQAMAAFCDYQTKRQSPTPDQVLSHRRLPTAWAIACKMREAGITPMDIGADDASRVTDTIADKKNWRST